MSNIPDFAPGCFGSALAYDDAAPICQVCKFAGECQPMHLTNLAALQTALSIPKRATAKREVEAQPVAAEMTLPVKVRALVDKLDKSNLRVTERLARGENPFLDTSSNFLKVVGHLLVRSSRPLFRRDFAMAFQMKLHWAPGTADSHARMAMQALTHIGAVDEIDGAVIVRRG